MIRNVIFDWSGTLVDDLPAVWRASNEVFRKAGIPEIPLDRFRAEFCLPFKSFYDRFVPHIPLPRLEEWFHGFFHQYSGAIRELPHARPFLEFCRQRGLRLFVLSTVRREYFAAQSTVSGFAEFFERTYLEVLDKRHKIVEVLVQHGLQAHETLFVGDMQHDIETAKHGGVHSCAVLTGYNGLEQLRASQPDLIVEHLGELRQLLEQNNLEIGGNLNLNHPSQSRHPIPTVGALIFNAAHQVLMVRTAKWSSLWGIPGGKIRWGEAAEDALRREIKEETNLDISAIRLVLVQDCIDSTEFYREAHFVLLNYLCGCQGEPVVVLNSEAQEYRWVTLSEALRLPLNQPTKILLAAVAKEGSVGPVSLAAWPPQNRSAEFIPPPDMDKISIRDLALWCRVGVSEEERSRPQRLLISVELYLDVSQAAETEDLRHTIDYYRVAQRLRHWGEDRQWKLIEKLAGDIANLMLQEFAPQKVFVEVKKMVLPEAGYVSVQVTRPPSPSRFEETPQ